MKNLYSLDLSHCIRLSPHAIANLLEIRHSSIAELRLSHCNFDVTISSSDTAASDYNANYEIIGSGLNIENEGGGAGRILYHAIRKYHKYGVLCLLDVRDCQHANQQRNGRRPFAMNLEGFNTDEARIEDALFVRGMQDLGFERKMKDFFIRPARLNAQIRSNSIEELHESYVNKQNL
mmetsp:Transcript_22987/g.32386  ORF Transcript_22987/g.32386 Transcript_22987/m.32386 type:complete len:178 (-) Transcript_22987:124-657(-)